MKQLLLVICFLVLAFPSWAGEVATIGGVADSAITSIDGVAGTGIASISGVDYDDGDAADGLIGNSGAGTGAGTGSYWFWTSYVTTTAGTVNYIHFRIAGANVAGSVNAGIYTAAGAKIQDGTHIHQPTLAGMQVITITLDAPVTLVAATTYILAWAHDVNNNPDIYYGTGTGRWSYYNTVPANMDSLESTLPTETGGYANSPIIIWADNTP